MPDPAERLASLFASARRQEPDLARLEFAFETRLLSRLREERGGSVLEWAWRLCPYFAVVAVAVSIWSRLFAGSGFDERRLVTEAGLQGEEHALYARMTGERD